MVVRLSSQENLSNNTESGLSFENKTFEAGEFSICPASWLWQDPGECSEGGS